MPVDMTTVNQEGTKLRTASRLRSRRCSGAGTDGTGRRMAAGGGGLAAGRGSVKWEAARQSARPLPIY